MANVFQSAVPETPANPTQPASLPVPPQKKTNVFGSANPVVRSGRLGAPPGLPILNPDQAAAETSKVVSGVSRGLDYQANLVRKALTGKSNYDDQMTAIRHKIPGMDWLYDSVLKDPNPAIGPNLGPLEAPTQAAARGFQHAARGVIDAAINVPLDPLTYETAGLGGLVKTAVGTATRAAVSRALLRTIPGRAAFKAVNFGGAAALKRADQLHGGNVFRGIEDVETAQGAGHRATAEGQRWENHVNQRVQKIIKDAGGLTPAEHRRVQWALNGEPAVEAADQSGVSRSVPLTPKEQKVFRQLRALTDLTQKQREQAALSVALRTQISDASLRDEVASYFKSGKEPIVPEPKAPRVKTPYGPPVPRQRVIPYEQPLADPNEVYAAVTHDLPQSDRELISKSLLSKDAFNRLPSELQARAAQIQEAIRKKHSMSGGDEFRELEPAPRYKMPPPNQSEIERMTKVREAWLRVAGHLATPGDADEGTEFVRFRQNYYPFQHHAGSEGHEAFTANPAAHFDPRNIKRENLPITVANDIPKDFASMAQNLNRQVRTRVLNESIPELLNDKEIEKLFNETVGATGKYRDDWDKVKSWWRAAIGWPRAGLVAFSPGHAMNELVNAANTLPLDVQPKFFKDSFGLAGKIFKAQVKGDFKAYDRLTREGRELGAGVGAFAERTPFFQHFPQWIPLVGGKSVPGFSQLARFNNNLVWSVSEALRQNYAKYLKDTGVAKTALQAGGKAERRLIDYQFRTPLQNLVRHIAPFGTYRGGLIPSVVGGVVRDPMRSAFLNRATGGVMYGDRPEPGQPGWESFVPTADVGRALTYVPAGGNRRTPISGPFDFTRSSLSAPLAAGLDVAQDVSPFKDIHKHYMSYGQNWLPGPNGQHYDLGLLVNSALAGVPEAQAILEAHGIGRFQWRGISNEIMRQFLRTQYVPPAPQATLAPFLPLPKAGAAPTPLATPTNVFQP